MGAPGAADKSKILQLFYEGIPRSRARVERIDRIAGPGQLQSFLQRFAADDAVADPSIGGESAAEQCTSNVDKCRVGFYAPNIASRIPRLREVGFCADDIEELPGVGFGVPIARHAEIAHESRCSVSFLQDQSANNTRCICVILCAPGAIPNKASSWQQACVEEPTQLLLTHIVWYEIAPSISPDDAAPLVDEVASSRPVAPDEPAVAAARAPPDPQKDKAIERRRQLMRQQREYAKVADPLIKVALQQLESAVLGTTGTVLLPTASSEAESVVSLYLLGGGGARVRCPPGVDPREALGGVVVQRIINQPLYRLYSEFRAQGRVFDAGAIDDYEKAANSARLREDIVWHGTRLKRVDGVGTSLATKLQSIAEYGFDPTRCTKGAAAEGGIWVATSPLTSFGSSYDGLVAFILCVAKTNFNEWVDATCARVLQRERVLPLYSLVHA